jgi:hypothetical protein
MSTDERARQPARQFLIARTSLDGSGGDVRERVQRRGASYLRVKCTHWADDGSRGIRRMKRIGALADCGMSVAEDQGPAFHSRGTFTIFGWVNLLTSCLQSLAWMPVNRAGDIMVELPFSKGFKPFYHLENPFILCPTNLVVFNIHSFF